MPTEAKWIPWAGGDCPVEPDAMVDLRFAGFDSIRGVGPRHHEMWDQQADSVRWQHIGSGPSTPNYHPTNIIAWRLSSGEQP